MRYRRRKALFDQWPLTISFAKSSQLWAPVEVGAEGFAAAERITRGCQSFPANSAALGFCLEIQQGGLLGGLNTQFWDAVGGS